MFKIIQTSAPYKPIPRSFPTFNISLKSNYLENFSTSHYLYISDVAGDQIADHIGWNDRTEQNSVEQGGLLLGNAYVDEEQKITFGIVERVVVGKSAVGSPGYLSMGHDTWKEMIDEVDAYLETEIDQKVQIIGWYHTHPNYLDVFMSGTDRATQSKMFRENWQFAVVLNPHRLIWRAFFGENALECKAALIDDSKSAQE